MSEVRYRALRFVLPSTLIAEPSRAWAAAGFQADATGRLAMAEDEAAIRQSIMLLISTTPGERVMRPDYGCSLARLVFAPNDETTAGLAIHHVRSAVTRWEPRVEIVHVDAIRDPDRAETLQILLDYRVRATRRIDRLRIPFDLRPGDV
jgi:phage baseplate assembly protein W